MSRIATFVSIEIKAARAKARGVYDAARDAIDKLARDPQCDAEDRKALEDARIEINLTTDAISAAPKFTKALGGNL